MRPLRAGVSPLLGPNSPSRVNGVHTRLPVVSKSKTSGLESSCDQSAEFARDSEQLQLV